MKTTPTIENAATWFNAKTVAHHFDVVDTRTSEGPTVRFYNADGFEFMTLTSDNVSMRFESLFGEKPVGAVSAVEETHTDVDKITSFFEDATSDEPWLVIVEPVEHE